MEDRQHTQGRDCGVGFVIRWVGALCAVVALVFAASAEAAGPPKQSLLWSTTAKTLTVGKSGKHYTVTAPGDSPTVWFTDRPGRSAGSTTLQGFVGGWETNRFDRSAPNAALVLRRGGKVIQSVVVLTRPTELANGSIRFRARILRKGDVMDMQTMDAVLPRGRYRNAALFIDAGDAPACPAMITSPMWCTLASTTTGGASTTVSLATPNKSGTTRTIRSCYWKGKGLMAASLTYALYQSYLRSESVDKNTSRCDTPDFARLDDAVWAFAPVNVLSPRTGEVIWTQNRSITFRLNSKIEDYGDTAWLYKSPKALIVVTDS